MQGLVEGQCERVFGALVAGVRQGGGEGVGEGEGEGASVNLVRGPVGVEGMWVGEEGEGEGFTGMCFCFFFLGVLFGFVFLFWGVFWDGG